MPFLSRPLFREPFTGIRWFGAHLVNYFLKSTENGFATRTTGSFSLNSSTQIYGLLAIPLGPVKAIRHVLSPSIGYSWTPDFSKPIFGKDLGYFLTKTDTNNNVVYHDRFSGSLGGNTPKSERKTMTFSLRVFILDFINIISVYSSS